MKLLTILILFYAVSTVTPWAFVMVESFMVQIYNSFSEDGTNEDAKLIQPAINTAILLNRQICDVFLMKAKDKEFGTMLVGKVADTILGCSILARSPPPLNS